MTLTKLARVIFLCRNFYVNYKCFCYVNIVYTNVIV